MSVVFEESVRIENVWLRPELRVAVDDIIRQSDVSALLYLQSSELSRSVHPVLDAETIVPCDRRMDTEVLLRCLIETHNNGETYYETFMQASR